MTVEEFKESFEHQVFVALKQARKLSPYKTGNLRNNGIQIQVLSEDKYKIIVDLSVAPYAQWLDDFAKVQREHPQGWFKEIALDIIGNIISKYKQGIEFGVFKAQTSKGYASLFSEGHGANATGDFKNFVKMMY